MCGFGIGTIFQVAIFVIVVLVVLALLRILCWGWFPLTRLLECHPDRDRRRGGDHHLAVLFLDRRNAPVCLAALAFR